MAPTNAETPQPTLSQAVALSMTYRLLWDILRAAPMAAVVVPLALKVIYFFVDFLTRSHTTLTLLMTISMTFGLRRSIDQAAPTPKHAKEALAKSRVSLPVAMFLLSCVMINLVLSPIEKTSGRQFFTASPNISISSTLRIAVGLALLGISVVFRYISPPSVMRCSSSPLAAPRYQVLIHELLSLLTLEGMRAALSVSPQQPQRTDKAKISTTGTMPLSSPQDNARRLQKPFWKSIISQIFLSSSLASVVSYTSVVPIVNASGYASTITSGLVGVCIVATLTQLCQTALNGRSHELDPIQTMYTFDWNRMQFHAMAAYFIPPSLLVVLWTILFQFYTGNKASGDMISALSISLVTGNVVYLYLVGIDATIRYWLCYCGVNLSNVVAEMADDDSLGTFLKVVMSSLLHQDTNLVSTLSTPLKQSYHILEHEELLRASRAAKDLAVTLLHKTRADEAGAHLEEDILCLTILASFGRGATIGRITPLQKRNLMHWIRPKDRIQSAVPRDEPLSAPLLRAICVFIGSLGEALVICSNQAPNDWLLPPGAIACGTYAVRGAARFILFSVESPGNGLADWRASHLSLLIPVFLTSLHRLEFGMIQFVQPTNIKKSNSSNAVTFESTELEIVRLFRQESPELLPLFEAIREAALTLLEKLHSLENARRVSFAVDHDCSVWINSIYSQVQRGPPTRPDRTSELALIRSVVGSP